jgi:hypothetical protein
MEKESPGAESSISAEENEAEKKKVGKHIINGYNATLQNFVRTSKNNFWLPNETLGPKITNPFLILQDELYKKNMNRKNSWFTVNSYMNSKFNSSDYIKPTPKV